MNIIELVRKLFGIAAPPPAVVSPEEILTGIIRDAMALNLESVTGAAAEVSVSMLKPGVFDRYMESAGPGLVSSVSCGDESPCFMFITGSDCLEKLHGVMKGFNGDIPGEEAGSAVLLPDRVEGNLFYLFLPGAGDGRDYFRFSRVFGKNDVESILWAASGSVVSEIRSGDFTAHIVVPRERWRALCGGVSDSDHAWRLRSIVVTAYTGHDAADTGTGPVQVNITKPKEFVLGRFFLPARLKFDDTRVSSVFRKVSSGEGFPGGEIFPVSLDLKVSGSVYRLWYGFRGFSLNEFNRRIAPFDSLFRSMLRDTLACIKSSCPELKVEGVRYSSSAGTPESTDDAVLLHADLKINFSPVDTVIAVPVALLDLVALSAFGIRNIRLLRDTLRNRLICLLSLNSALFSRSIGSFINSFRGGEGFDDDSIMPEPLSCLPFYEFIDLVSDDDLKIITQNFIMPRFSSAYMRLFSIGVPLRADGERAEIRVYTAVTDIDRFKKFLPRTVVDEADGLRQWTPRDEFDGLNMKTMLDMYAAAMSDRLVLSARAKFILRNQFFDAVQARSLSELGKLKDAGEPFASMEGVAYNIRQLAVSRTGDRDICLAMLEAGDKVSLVTPLLSRARREKILDGLDVMRPRYRAGEITASEVVQGIRAVIGSIEREKSLNKEAQSARPAREKVNGGTGSRTAVKVKRKK